MKAFISIRDRSKVITALLEKEIKKQEEHLYLTAKKLEEDVELRDDMPYLALLHQQITNVCMPEIEELEKFIGVG
jgi:hypothetical protein